MYSTIASNSPYYEFIFYLLPYNSRTRHVCIATVHYLQRMKIVKFQMYRKKKQKKKDLSKLMAEEAFKKNSAKRGKPDFGLTSRVWNTRRDTFVLYIMRINAARTGNEKEYAILRSRAVREMCSRVVYGWFRFLPRE